ncbi:MAG: hypothetical protein ACK41T_03655 [Pseudobdellovibrio sp.]
MERTIINAKELINLIKAGYQANCEKIQVNDIIISYFIKPNNEITHQIVTPTIQESEKIDKQQEFENIQDQDLYLDPVSFEERLVLEELHGKNRSV